MSILLFKLCGDLALWRNVYESMGTYSCLGPAPSNISGIIGAALGFASPRSNAYSGKSPKNKEIPWPVSAELLSYLEDNDIHLACRWLGESPKRIPWNVNGYKELNLKESFRIQQQLIENPSYEIAVKLPPTKAIELVEALKMPAFPIYLGVSFCRAFITNIRIENQLPEADNWAFRYEFGCLGEAVPFSRLVINSNECGERIESDGYWVYPTKDNFGIKPENPLVQSYVKLDK